MERVSPGRTFSGSLTGFLAADSDKTTLGSGFKLYGQPGMPSLGLHDVVSMLYDVRCDVVHEGNYWGFTFHDGDTPMVNSDPDVMAYITYEQFRSILVRGCIHAVQERLPAP